MGLEVLLASPSTDNFMFLSPDVRGPSCSPHSAAWALAAGPSPHLSIHPKDTSHGHFMPISARADAAVLNRLCNFKNILCKVLG